MKEALAKYDNDLFQTGRLITCGLYVNVILKDYVRTILSLNRTTSLWDLDPRNKQTASLLQTTTAEGLGNQVSVEFNLIYRWHAVSSSITIAVISVNSPLHCTINAQKGYVSARR